MIAIDKDVCRILAAKEGLPFDFIAKEFYLMDLLRKLSEMGVLDELVLKGGTALKRQVTTSNLISILNFSMSACLKRDRLFADISKS